MRALVSSIAVLIAACGVPVEGSDSPVTEPNTERSVVMHPRLRKCSPPQTLADILAIVEPDSSIMSKEISGPPKPITSPRTRFGKLMLLTNKCYKGTPTDSSAEQVADIQHWSWALGSAAIRIEHALEDGSYGGVSYVYPTIEPDAFTYVYITNAGFHTEGTIILNDDQSFTASETVEGHPSITSVRSHSTFDENGLISMTSEFLDGEEWRPGPGFTHEITTEPFPRLKPPTPAAE
ncbi:MAG: hypothetical protein AAGL97_04530 [Pseudomonadota bacterium]